MNRKKWFVLIGSIAIVGVLLLSAIQLWGPTSEAQALTEEEAKVKATEKYKGEIIETTKKDNKFHFVLEAETGTYLIIIDALSGDVISISQQAKNKEQAKEEEPKKTLTEEEVKGKISAQVTI